MLAPYKFIYMQYYISKGEAQYMDANKGYFSKALAEWAISRMQREDERGELTSIKAIPLEKVEETLKKHNIEVPDESRYDAWYLYNMCVADYTKSLPSEDKIVEYIDETINDPDCEPTAVLACFRAKMDVMNIPIHWERFI